MTKRLILKRVIMILCHDSCFSRANITILTKSTLLNAKLILFIATSAQKIQCALLGGRHITQHILTYMPDMISHISVIAYDKSRSKAFYL